MSTVRTDRKRISLLLLSIIAMLGALTASSQVAAAQTEKIIYTFPSGDNADITFGQLLLQGAGNLFGATLGGGAYGAGTVYKVTLGGTKTVLYIFTGGADGGTPAGGLIADLKGNLYGTTEYGGVYGFGTVFQVTPAGTEKVLYSFTGKADGNLPYGGLVRDAAGNLYGTTYYGGSSNACASGCGVVFEVTPTGTERVLHNFTGEPDGWCTSNGALLLVGSNLYGVTGCGGTYNKGIVFKVTLAGKETILYSFAGGTDGGGPSGGLIRDAKGSLYGTTLIGGDSLNSPNCNNANFAGGCGTVFELSPAGVETVLYNFEGGTDGIWPFTGVVRDTNGNIYGSTLYGGNSACMYGCGTVFKVTPLGTETQLFLFSGGATGTWPEGVVRDTKGNLYGATGYGGNPGCHALGCGLVFEITP
jgi:uncharacterized repeat protein (TIGR03803 family)